MSRVWKMYQLMKGFWGIIKSEMFYLQKLKDFDDLKHEGYRKN